MQEIIDVLSSKEAIEMDNHLKYLEQMLSPAMWQSRQSQELKKSFVNRRSVEEKLAEWLRTEDASRSFILYGEPGTGKSTFLINFQHLNHEAGAIAFCDWGKYGTDKIKEMIRSIAFQLATKKSSYRTALIWHLENKTSAYQDLPEEELFEFLLVEPLRGCIHTQEECYVIIIDAINELNEGSKNRLANIIATQGEYLPKTIRFLISARKDNVITPYFSDCVSYEILPNTEETLVNIKNFYKIELGELLEKYDENEAERLLDILAKNSE